MRAYSDYCPACSDFEK